jgi:hypothetical protein
MLLTKTMLVHRQRRWWWTWWSIGPYVRWLYGLWWDVLVCCGDWKDGTRLSPGVYPCFSRIFRLVYSFRLLAASALLGELLFSWMYQFLYTVTCNASSICFPVQLIYLYPWIVPNGYTEVEDHVAVNSTVVFCSKCHYEIRTINKCKKFLKGHMPSHILNLYAHAL